jgi:hypothetical protein
MTREFTYARIVDDDEIVLLPTGVRRYALRSLFEFRSKVVADIEVADITVFTMGSGTREHTWTRSSGRWTTVVAGDTIRGDRTVITDYMRRIRALRATDFIDGTMRIDNPAGFVELQRGPQETIRFTFTAAESALCYVASSVTSRVAQIDAGILDAFQLGVEDFRDRHVVAFEPDSVAHISLETPRTSISLLKRGPEWTFPNPAFGDIDQAAITVLLRELESLRFREILAPQLSNRTDLGLAPAPYRLSLADAEGRLIDRIDASAMQKIGRVRHATSLSSGYVGVLDTEPLDEIEGLLNDLRGD